LVGKKIKAHNKIEIPDPNLNTTATPFFLFYIFSSLSG